MHSMRFISIFALCGFLFSSCGLETPWNKTTTETEVVTLPPLTPPAEGTTPPISTTDPGTIDPQNINLATLGNLAPLIQLVNAGRWHERGANCQNMTIAVFDNGFDGLEESKGVRLPPDLVVEKAPANEPAITPHGTKLAEVIWSLCTGSRLYSPDRPGPKLKLFNTNGYTNLTAAVEAVTTTEKVDIVLYSQVWEYGGNFDGRGFINALVNRVTSQGILWVNAAGNFGQSSWQGPVSFNEKGHVRLPFEQQSVRFTVSADATPVKLTLAWNDFTDLKTYRTSQDLDLHLEDSSRREIAASKLIQDGTHHTGDPAYSAYAREQLTTVLNKGTYYIRVTSTKPEGFNRLSRLRLAGDGAGLVFLDQTQEASIMVPADNTQVITVGASDVDFTSAGRVIGTNIHKPEVLAPSILTFDNGETFAGSSSAAAVAAAVFAIYQSACGKLTETAWKNYLAQGYFRTPRALSSGAATQLALPGLARCLPEMGSGRPIARN